MLPIPIKIKAVTEDPAAPLLDCYQETPDALVKIFASRSTTTPPTTPKEKPKMLNMTGYDGNHRKVEKVPVAGINATNDPARLIDILERLELISGEFAKPLRTIAANGAAESLKDVCQISVYKLDKALAGTTATIEARMAFKASLDRFGLLVVPR